MTRPMSLPFFLLPLLLLSPCPGDALPQGGRVAADNSDMQMQPLHMPVPQHYHQLLRRGPDAPNPAKRGGAAQLTRYAPGLGACGGSNTDSDHIVALNRPQWDGGAHCYETVTITYGGKSAQAQIVDECIGCPPNALDLSNGLFAYFADPTLGQLYGDWSFGAGASPNTTPGPQTQTQAAPAKTHSTSTTVETPAVQSSSVAAVTQTRSASTTSQSPSSSATATGATTPLPGGILYQIEMVLAGLGGLAVAAAGGPD